MGETTTTTNDIADVMSPPATQAATATAVEEREIVFDADLNGHVVAGGAAGMVAEARSEPIIVRQPQTDSPDAGMEPEAASMPTYGFGGMLTEADTAAAGTAELMQGAPAETEPSWTYTPGPVSQEEAETADPVYAVPMFGPTGRHRSPMLVAFLSIITLGLYSLALHYSWNGEMSDFDARLTVRPARSTWGVTLPWLAGLASTVVGAATVVVSLTHVSLPFTMPISTTVGWVLLFGLVAVPYLELVFPLSVVSLVMTAERIRVVEDRVGTGTDVQIKPTRSVCWLLLPVIGGLVMLTRLQSRLNGAWDRVAPPASSHSR